MKKYISPEEFQAFIELTKNNDRYSDEELDFYMAYTFQRMNTPSGLRDCLVKAAEVLQSKGIPYNEEHMEAFALKTEN
jgi:hypothetical protein